MHKIFCKVYIDKKQQVLDNRLSNFMKQGLMTPKGE